MKNVKNTRKNFGISRNTTAQRGLFSGRKGRDLSKNTGRTHGASAFSYSDFAERHAQDRLSSYTHTGARDRISSPSYVAARQRRENGRTNTLERGYYSDYNDTSSAYKLAPVEYTRQEPQRVIYKTVRIRSKKVEEVYTSEKEALPLNLYKIYGVSIILFGLVMAFLAISAGNNTQRERIVAMSEELDSVREDNEYTRAAIDEKINLEEIEQKALELGLQKPAEYQMRDIEIPADSYTVQYDTSSAIHHSVGDTFKSLLGME
ncbi:MAG: hypothetical protein IJS61_03725 [Firmicutes bacterium]|nr:hypothetical protein [Bacillota bacterium]